MRPLPSAYCCSPPRPPEPELRKLEKEVSTEVGSKPKTEEEDFTA